MVVEGAEVVKVRWRHPCTNGLSMQIKASFHVCHLSPCLDCSLTSLTESEHLTTPSQHRERLPAPGRSTRPPEYLSGHLGGFAPNHQHTQTPMHRQPLGSLNGNAPNNSRMSGYGMSAGMKAGRQQSVGPMNGHIRNSGSGGEKPRLACSSPTGC